MEKEQLAFQIHQWDNVATALGAIQPGVVLLLGDTCMEQITSIEEVAKGHKIALMDMKEGTDILKYGVRIGQSIMPIKAGCWVHIHNIHSVYDQRSSHLDAVTGAPKDIKYE